MADDYAARLHTINYEITCLVGQRVPRLYFRNGKIVQIKSVTVDKAFKCI